MIIDKVQPLEQLEKPRRMSDLALNCAIFFLDCLVPTDIERGAIAVPDSIKERAERRGLRRRSSYDQLKSPPPELRAHVEQAVVVREDEGLDDGTRKGEGCEDGGEVIKMEGKEM